MNHGYNIQANPSKQNLGSQKATAEDPSDSDGSDCIPMHEIDQISDSEAKDSDDKNENTSTKGAKKGEIPLIHN